MNKKIYDILSSKINEYTSYVDTTFNSSNSSFEIIDSFFNTLKDDKKLQKSSGIHLIAILENNNLDDTISIVDQSSGGSGVSFLIKFDGAMYTVRFTSFKEMGEMKYYIHYCSEKAVKYSAKFLDKYILLSALEKSKLKGSYFTMPRNHFSWDIKDIEERSFDDIFLPDDIMDDLHLYVDIFEDSQKILRYLKVGNPGVGKTESTIIIANELNKMGVTIIKTPICETLHSKVELANLLAPALIIFDDIDLSLGDRNSGAYSTLLGDFLDVLDGTDKLSDDVGIIATTNAAHLLDLAAQRPGRFDKTLLFDNVTKDNILNIIKKSLKVNFDITEGNDFDIFTSDIVVDKFFTAAVSGAHVFNSIKMLKLRYNTLKITDVTTSKVIKSIESELAVIEKVRKTSFLKDKFDRSKPTMGFSMSNDLVHEVTEGESPRPRRNRRGSR